MSELPNGWVKTTLGQVVDYGRTEKANSEHISDDTWVLELEDIEKNSSKLLNKVSFLERQPKSSKNAFKVGDVLYGKLRPYLNKIIIAKDNGICTSEIIPLRVEKGLVDNHFLFYWLKGIEFSSYVTAVSYGVNMPRLGTKDGKQAPLILAPLAEQKRIVEKLDQVLAQVDTIKARLDGIPAILKRFRQSVLAAAVSGKLTEEWRGSHDLTGSWKKKLFIDICREITVGFVGKMSDKYTVSGVPFLRSQNVRAFRFSRDNLLYISKEFHNEIYKSRLEPGDLAIVRSGAPGTTCVIPKALDIANCSDLVIARPNSELNAEFGCIFMNSEIAQKNVSENQVGIAQQHFNVGSMKKMPINLPSLEEQIEIVRLVDQYFAFADTIEKQVQKAQQRVDKLTQSILAKAFRGELVPQNPDDEPADELLKRIAAARAESEALAKAAKKVGKKK
ncbi:MAG: restriction endonuclease subunit S [Marinomonas sp.]|uniref:restriction endonuclease subunit S n=1 Tax=Marinomonas sp. TaxID=1904862 RepID=UPI003F9C3EC0